MAECGIALLQQAEELLCARDAQHALAAFHAAEAVQADRDRCAAGRWIAHMLLGEFEAAWRESDAIRERGLPDPHRFWMGEAIEGRRVILRCLHGFGDSVQLLRYAPQLRAHSAKLIVEVAPAFVALARCFDGVDEVLTWGEQAPELTPEWDVQIEVAELPYFFRTHISDLPVASNYLHIPRSRDIVEAIGTRDTLHIGLVWASGSWNPSRSVPLEMLRPLLLTPGCEFWNLQGGAAWEQATALGDLSNFHTDLECEHSLVRLARLVTEMDVVITPDTLAAHLAGALGRPAWVMLEHAADWRWMLEREDSPWYPSLRLLRQPGAGDWSSVIESIQHQLHALIAHRAKGN